MHIVEQNTANCPRYCDWNQPYGCPAGQAAYYGRGPIQLSWNFNYKAAGDALGIDLLGNPWLVQNDAAVAWKTGLWYWNTQSGPGTMTPHNAMVNGAGFGQTLALHNGSLECDGRNPAQVQSRVTKYQQFSQILGVSAGRACTADRCRVCQTPPMTSETITADVRGHLAPRRPARPPRRLRRDAADGQRRLPPRHAERPRALPRRAAPGRELGVNHIDTAAFYCLLPALRQRTDQQRAARPTPTTWSSPPRSARTATGRAQWAPPPRPEDLRSHVEENLRQLGRDHLDVVYLRRMRQDSVAEHFGALAELREAWG
ncbi:hypothetical protein SVIOM342S_01886 [Streptomyces violaceorubidus]